ncbi:MAG TPA: hypothetical protein DDY14_15725 [Chromatiaceae bacterium]|mgnify:CR=1 FL=1|jgi:hypothetical protein|nr:MAG: hypothetical protein N838_11035 [Thiohalocapsa sp. PB-PSB1]QQO52573.1 MAG: hypothetical protein N838_03505 [Thiohalocapsa sp. PB-PSB1]HBG96731.1 hypothetical protein [Chromatiaceae bacterium]HCS92132.1 hypothetical protein [Chromatiaceae bacterium]
MASLFAPMAAALMIVAASPLFAQLSTATPEYKCYASMMDNTRTVLFFYQQGNLPERFSDQANIARADIPDSMRKQLVMVHECVLRQLEFSDPAAGELEAMLPQ